MEKRFSTVSYGKEGIVEGYAVKWGVPSWIPQLQRKEMFIKGSIKTPRTVGLFAQHDQSKVLGSTKSKTLELEEDETGLKFRCKLPVEAKATRELLERGDLAGASMAFTVSKDEYAGGMRRIKSCDLSEISLVHDPCHDAPVTYRSAQKPKRKWTDLL